MIMEIIDMKIHIAVSLGLFQSGKQPTQSWMFSTGYKCDCVVTIVKNLRKCLEEVKKMTDQVLGHSGDIGCDF